MIREYDNFPQELKNQQAWVCYNIESVPGREKPTKVPYNPLSGKKASSKAPITWTTFAKALEAMKKFKYSGIGYVFSKNGYVGIDIDNCRIKETGELSDIGKRCLELLPTYCEISPSGTGLHFIAKGVLPPKGRKNSETGVEMYEEARFFTVTGESITGKNDPVSECQGGIEEVHKFFIAKEKKAKAPRKVAVKTVLTDDEVIQRAQASSNGEDFKLLYEGKWQDKYSSQSEADLAFAMKLAFWTGRDKEQMDRIFKSSGLNREKWETKHYVDGRTYGEEVLEKACDSTEEVYEALDSRGRIIERGNTYVKIRPDGNSFIISNFVIRPLELIQDSDEAQLRCIIQNDIGQEYKRTFMTVEMSNLQSFKRCLNQNTISLSYTGTEGDLELIKAHVSKQKYPIKQGVRGIGIFKVSDRWAFVDRNRAIDSEGNDVGEIVPMAKSCEIESDILESEVITKEELEQIAKPLLEYNEHAKTVTVLCFAAACFVKEKLRQSGIKFPHLIMTGEAGSGKSNTMEKVLYPIFSSKSITGAGKMTGFTLLKTAASSNTIPFLMDEYKPSTLEKTRVDALMNFLRDAYDGHAGQRGRPDMSVILYKLNAPVVMAGEESPMETAIKERSMELLFSKSDLKSTDRLRAFNKLVMSENLLKKLGKTLLLESLKLDQKELKEHHQKVFTSLEDRLPSRIRNNTAVLMCGELLLEKLAERFGMSLQELFNKEPEVFQGNLVYSVKEYLLDGNDHNKSVVDKTFEIFDRMELTPDVHYTFIKNYERIGFDLKLTYDLFTKYVRDHAVAGEVLPYTQFIRQIKRKDYFHSYGAVRFGTEIKRGYIFDLEKMATSCDIDKFVVKAEMLRTPKKYKDLNLN
ncbi:phage NrS-1 polymerase family protein [Youngiibacter fragilis]|uniref:DNA primase n=1 Tax=Youngiibacter fragilis 232.1 TaxID=994573 RepID=V7I613_9CLOT|nr:DNA primase [Youngiibacter fragilis]ETA80447.1 DNA primase [Youngiibacter fragilis 232.1]